MDLIVADTLTESSKNKKGINLHNETSTVNRKHLIHSRVVPKTVNNKISENDEDTAMSENMRIRYLQMQSLIRLANSKLDLYINDEHVKKPTPVTVEVYMIFLRVGEIDNVKEQFQAEAYFEASWEDDSVNPNEPFNEKHNWEPALLIENAVSNLKQEIKYRVESVAGKTKIYECRSIKAIFWERLELWDFPLGIIFYF
jgi:hypothetical protein